MSSVMLNATCSFFDIKNIEESRLPSKTGAVRFLAVSALVASVFASALIPAVISTGVIAATTAAIMLKNRQVEQLNESDLVDSFKSKINNYNEKEKNNLLVICLGCLIKKIKQMPETINTSKKPWQFWNAPKPVKEHFSTEMQKYLKKSNNELVQEKSEDKVSITLEGDQRKIEELSALSTLSIIEHLYTQLGKSDKAKDIAKFIQEIQSNTENSVDQTEK